MVGTAAPQPAGDAAGAVRSGCARHLSRPHRPRRDHPLERPAPAPRPRPPDRHAGAVEGSAPVGMGRTSVLVLAFGVLIAGGAARVAWTASARPALRLEPSTVDFGPLAERATKGVIVRNAGHAPPSGWPGAAGDPLRPGRARTAARAGPPRCLRPDE